MTSIAAAVDANVEGRVRAEQLRLLFEHGHIAFFVNAAAATLLAIVVGVHVARRDVITWLIVYATAWILRGALYVIHRRHPKALPESAWRNLFACGVFAAGVSWGLSAVWLFPPITTDRVFVAVTIIGLASGATASLSCVRGIYPLYIFPAFLPIAVRFGLDGGLNALPVIVLGVVYCVGMSAAASMNYRLMSSALRLRFKNAELALALERLATHDPLTGLPNRLLFNERLTQTMRRSKRSGDPLAVAFLDFDGFKEINDRFGHDAGDEFLKKVAGALARSVRETDTVARFGGDEFVILMERCGDESMTRTAMRRIRESLQIVVDVGVTKLNIRFSIGVARYPDDATDEEALLKAADMSMYAAKRAGGNAVSFAGDSKRAYAE